MLSNLPEDANAVSPAAGAAAKPSATPAVRLNPRSSVEVVSKGSGTTNDPAGTDRTPPAEGPPGVAV